MSAPEQHVSILQAEMRRLEAFLGTLACRGLAAVESL